MAAVLAEEDLVVAAVDLAEAVECPAAVVPPAVGNEEREVE
jgi:hypothetical protein